MLMESRTAGSNIQLPVMIPVKQQVTVGIGRCEGPVSIGSLNQLFLSKRVSSSGAALIVVPGVLRIDYLLPGALRAE
jgi:hypothetical protein